MFRTAEYSELISSNYLSTRPRNVRQVLGGAGHDVIDGGYDTYLIEGGDGNDQLSARTGDDVLDGGVGNDRLEAGSGADRLIGGIGDDTLYGGGGFAWIFGFSLFPAYALPPRTKFPSTLAIIWKAATAMTFCTADMVMISRQAMRAPTRCTAEQVTTH